MSFSRLLSTLLIAALCGAAMCQTLPSSCNACTGLNLLYVYGGGQPSVVWCSATAPTPSPIASSSGTCVPTKFLVQRPFLEPSLSDIQCDAGNQAAPCPPTAPFASFAPCDCAQSCFRGEKEGASYLLRSCESCVALGGNWIAGDDLMSSACIKYSYVVKCDADETGCPVASWGFPYCRAPSLVDSRLLKNDIGKTPQVYTTLWQCAHGTSFCSSIRIGASGCVAMIFFLCLIPLALIIMCLARMFPAEALNATPESGFLCMVRFPHSHSQICSFIPAIVTEFWISYFWAPFVLIYYPLLLIFGLILAWSKLFEKIMCPSQQHAPAGPADAATEHTQLQPAGADACVGTLTECNQSVNEQSAAHRLQELERMLSEGLVTVEEHKRRRSAILECMEPLELEQVRASA